MKFLIIRFSSIGDIVLASPAIRCLKQQLPDAEIHMLTKQSFKAVTEANPYISKFHYFKDNLSGIIEILKEEDYDYIVDLHKNFRTWRIKRALKKPVLAFRKLTLEKWLLTKLGINRMPGRHISLRSVDALQPLGIRYDGKGLDYFIPEGKGIQAGDLPTAHAAGYIALVIGASYATKKMPVDQLRTLCQLLAYPIVLVGGPEDQTAGEAIASDDPIRIYNACGKFSLHESADIVRKAKLVISHDTGLQYIACAFNKPVLAIWGATSPKLDVEPFYHEQADRLIGQTPYHNFMVPGLSCQPCSNYGTRSCPKGHFHCMKKQDLHAIAAKAQSYLT
jgi:heptosyltransferase-2